MANNIKKEAFPNDIHKYIENACAAETAGEMNEFGSHPEKAESKYLRTIINQNYAIIHLLNDILKELKDQ